MKAAVVIAFSAALCAVEANAYIEAMYPLAQIMKESDNIVEGKIEKVNIPGKRFIIKTGKTLKGKCNHPTIKVNVGVGQGAWPEPLMRHAVEGEPILLFYNNEPKSVMYLNRFFIQVYGDNNPEAEWVFTHVEMRMNRTYHKPQPDLVKLVTDILAGKSSPPEPDPKLKPWTPEKLNELKIFGEKGWDVMPPPPPPPKPRMPDKVAVVKGLKYGYYEGSWEACPDFTKLTPAKTGVVDTFDITPRAKNEGIGFLFTGYIEVPKDGTYNFYTTSDDGSILWIDKAEVVSNDGPHGAQEMAGDIPLKKGLHPIKVAFFQGGGEFSLDVLWDGPGIEKQKIPAKVLFHAEPKK